MLGLVLILAVVNSSKLVFHSGETLNANCTKSGVHNSTHVPKKAENSHWADINGSHWIWVNSTVPETCTFSSLKFSVGDDARVTLKVSADDSAKIVINDHTYLLKGADLSHIAKFNLDDEFGEKGDYEVEFVITNKGGKAGLLYKLDVDQGHTGKSKTFWILLIVGIIIGVAILG